MIFFKVTKGKGNSLATATLTGGIISTYVFSGMQLGNVSKDIKIFISFDLVMPRLRIDPMRNNAKCKERYLNVNVPQNVVFVIVIEMRGKTNNNVQQ